MINCTPKKVLLLPQFPAEMQRAVVVGTEVVRILGENADVPEGCLLLALVKFSLFLPLWNWDNNTSLLGFL